MRTDKVLERLDSIPSLSRAGKPINGLSRLIGALPIWDQAYGRISSNDGSMTAGVDGETFDGFSLDKVNNIIKRVLDGSYEFSPVRRVYIPKSNGQKRPLGIPTVEDRLVQEVVRSLLDRVYDPIFSRYSHGFRSGRSCHTALRQIGKNWTGTKWFVNVDIAGFFDSINHDVLLELLRKRIQDEKIILLVKKMLEAGYLENWRYVGTYSGTPQGGVISPLLANIVLHELDCFVMDTIKEFDSGKDRKVNPAYRNVSVKIQRLRNKAEKSAQSGDFEASNRFKREAAGLLRDRSALPYGDMKDPNFKRLKYVRYADDFLLGVIGSKAEAVAIKELIESFLKDTLKLEVAHDKTCVRHVSEGVVFLGYEIVEDDSKTVKTADNDASSMRYMHNRKIREGIKYLRFKVPVQKRELFLSRNRFGDLHANKAMHRPELAVLDDLEIVQFYNATIRGFVEYYKLADSARYELKKVHWIWLSSLLKTLANKHKSSRTKEAHRLQKTCVENGFPKNPLGIVYSARGVMRKLLLFRFEAVDWSELKGRKVDLPPKTAQYTMARTSYADRLNATECEWCGSKRSQQNRIVMHHVHRLKDRVGTVLWKFLDSARKRKQIALCEECHKKHHAGKLDLSNRLKDAA
jgi:group II intron reverse transcriptase/maturase